ncbi:hypothetical protein [Egicoccus sp. AB-alg6-2]|uniref:hypothetical protein n=1 Tax=Egicoccus sp. AB-alg6-2 TaxID=3242692 RepID=UPI00359CC903
MNQFAAELRKLRTVPTTWVITGIGLALVVLSALLPFLVPGFGGDFTGAAGQVASSVDTIGGNSIIVLIIGVLVVTTEFRHGTIGRTLQLVPSRTRVLAVKLAAGAAYAVAFVGVSLVLVAVILFAMAAVENVSLSWGAEVWTALWQVFVGLGLTAMLGVAVGALLRSQVVAVTLVLVWVFVVENLAMLLPRVAQWLPFQALNSVFLTAETRAQMPPGMRYLEPAAALATFLGYVAVLTTAAVVLMRERDV